MRTLIALVLLCGTASAQVASPVDDYDRLLIQGAMQKQQREIEEMQERQKEIQRQLLEMQYQADRRRWEIELNKIVR